MYCISIGAAAICVWVTKMQAHHRHHLSLTATCHDGADENTPKFIDNIAAVVLLRLLLLLLHCLLRHSRKVPNAVHDVMWLNAIAAVLLDRQLLLISNPCTQITDMGVHFM